MNACFGKDRNHICSYSKSGSMHEIKRAKTGEVKTEKTERQMKKKQKKRIQIVRKREKKWSKSEKNHEKLQPLSSGLEYVDYFPSTGLRPSSKSIYRQPPSRKSPTLQRYDTAQHLMVRRHF